MAQKVAVIGSNSFSGATFVDYLLERGEEVVGMSRSPEPSDATLPYKWRDHTAFRFLQLDLNRDLDAMMDAIHDFRPSYVINFAAQSMVAESWRNPDHWFMTNVVSTVRLHEQLRHCEFLQMYVHVTTPEVYGSTSGYVDESAPFRPSTPYAVSRAAADMSLRTYHEAYGFPVVFTRAANVYGPGQQLYRIIPRTILFILLGQKLQLHGGGQSRRAFVYGHDVADATWRIATQGVPGEAYHISTTEVITVRELVERICAKLDVSFDASVEIVGERLGKDAAYMLDSTKLRETLGWRDRISLNRGLDECIVWVQRHFDELRHQEFDYVHKP